MTANEPLESALKAGLRYVTDDRPGIRRHKVRGGFRYTAPDGTPLTDRAHLTSLLEKSVRAAKRKRSKAA